MEDERVDRKRRFDDSLVEEEARPNARRKYELRDTA